MAQQTALQWLSNELESSLVIDWPMNVLLKNKLAEAEKIEEDNLRLAVELAREKENLSDGFLVSKYNENQIIDIIKNK